MTSHLPPWVTRWCRDHLGTAPVEAVSAVVGVELDDGRRVVIESRPDESGRAVACVAAQLAAAEAGLPCARPVSAVTLEGGVAVHAEQWRPGGHVLQGNDPGTAARCAVLFAQVTAVTADLATALPLPNPVWVRWDPQDPSWWPPSWLDERAAAVELPAFVEDTARRARARITSAPLPSVVGHADWEAQNLRWHDVAGDLQPYAVHDWDSLAWLPEAAVVGAASGAFASDRTPTLAPVESSAAFLDAYQGAQGRTFTGEEREVAWAASLLTAVHNARAEVLCASAPVAAAALHEQAAARLALAGA